MIECKYMYFDKWIVDTYFVVKESVDKIPELSAELRKEALHQEQAGNPPPPLSVTSDERTDFSNLNLSHENVLIDTYALIKAFQSASKIWLQGFIHTLVTENCI